MSHMIHHILHTVARLLAFIAAIVLFATAPACTTTPQGKDRSHAGTVLSSASQAHGYASPGAVAQAPLTLAELFVEGDRSDRDNRVTIGYREVSLAGTEHLDLLSISDAAGAQGDPVTQYAALHLAVTLAPPSDRAACWERYAGLFASLPPCGAAALADALDDDIMNAEKAGNGLSADSAIAESARMKRAAREYIEANRSYEDAQGYIDDDEQLIMKARVHAHAAGVIGSRSSDTMFELQVRRLLAATRGDLWESQVMDADATFSGGRNEWRARIAWGRERAASTLRLYERGMTPTPRPISLQ